MQHKEQILKILEEYGPKHFSKKIKNTPELNEYISQYNGETISEKVYNMMHPNENVCINGNTKIFNSINNGYRFCGKTSTCICAKESVSIKCKQTKLSYTDEKKKEINDKRVNTNIKTHGVANTGQLQSAIKTRNELYSDVEKVSKITNKVKLTKLQKYGDENYNNKDKIKESLKKLHTVEYWCDRLNNPEYSKLHDKQTMNDLLHEYNPIQISILLNVHVQTVYRHLNILGLRDPYKSYAELELIGFLQSLGITNIIRNSRKLLGNGKEIDIYLPDYNIAIEYNGVYWHHEDVPNITRTYHYEKFIKCKEKNIQLLTIFSTTWNDKKEIVKKMLITKLGLNSEKIFARKCEIKSVNTRDIKDFLNKNHVQGYTSSSINYGLFYQDELVSVMTFSKNNTRMGIGRKEEGYELIRYATSIRVVGGASKLLSHFIKEHSPNKIISYSNNEWSTGNMYNALGFTLESEINPSYWYISPNSSKMYHRLTFSKQKLIKKGYSPELTEREITSQMKLMRLWDCGKRRWVMVL